MTKQLITLFICVQGFVLNAQQILDEKERAQVIDEILDDRFNNLLPKLMDAADIDMWVVISREYNEDPVIKTMLPATWLNARRRTILLFYRNKEKNSIEKLAVAVTMWVRILYLPGIRRKSPINGSAWWN